MKSVKNIFFLLFFVLLCSSFTISAEKTSKVYIAGVSASFSDSIVYFTDVQGVEGASIHNKMLENRSQYSSQFKDYLEQNKGLKNRTSFVYFSNKKSGLEKVLKKVKSKYSKNKAVVVRYINISEFKFERPSEE